MKSIPLCFRSGSKTLAAAALALCTAQAAFAEDTVATRTEGKTPTWPGISSSALEKFGGEAGVHNWVDPCGLTEGILTLRMAEFPDSRPLEGLAASGRVVKLADLESALPPGTREVTPDERAAQLGARRAAYLRRLPEVTA